MVFFFKEEFVGKILIFIEDVLMVVEVLFLLEVLMLEEVVFDLNLVIIESKNIIFVEKELNLVFFEGVILWDFNVIVLGYFSVIVLIMKVEKLFVSVNFVGVVFFDGSNFFGSEL